MKKIVFAVLVAAFGYNCVVAQNTSISKGAPRSEVKEVKMPAQATTRGNAQTAPAVQPVAKSNAHIKPFYGKGKAVRPHVKVANKPKAKAVKSSAAPRPIPGKGHAYGHSKNKHHKGNYHGNANGHQNNHHCQKPAQTLNLFPAQQPQQQRPVLLQQQPGQIRR